MSAGRSCSSLRPSHVLFAYAGILATSTSRARKTWLSTRLIQSYNPLSWLQPRAIVTLFSTRWRARDHVPLIVINSQESRSEEIFFRARLPNCLKSWTTGIQNHPDRSPHRRPIEAASLFFGETAQEPVNPKAAKLFMVLQLKDVANR